MMARMTGVRCAVLLVLGWALACGAGGCATASIAAAGTVAGIAATAISTGGDIYRLGKLNSADEATYPMWVGACRAAAVDLHFTIKKQIDKGNGKWFCTIEDDNRDRIDIHVERLTEKICLTRIDVGVFGSEPTAHLILAAIRWRAQTSASRPSASAPSTRAIDH
jgi:hypothetical protein